MGEANYNLSCIAAAVTLARHIAANAVKREWRAVGLRLSDYDARDLAMATQCYLARHPELLEQAARILCPEISHAHGTGMAGAIAAHQRLLGTALAARLLAVHAFSSTAATAESTTFNILRGINWSAQEGARIINMSFAGPRDPSLARSGRRTTKASS